MDELISRQAAIEKINERAREMFSILPGFEYYLGALHDVAADLRNMQIIDATHVIRCKDCKWLETDSETLLHMCGLESSESLRELDDYCSMGERKENV